MLNLNDVVGVGGKVTPGTVLAAYCEGVFPWFANDQTDVLWWSPDPRFVLDLSDLHYGRTVRRTLKKLTFTLDSAFDQVIQTCADMRYDKRPNGGTERMATWITPSMALTFRKLHREGLAHSVEAWDGSELVGGLYGLAIGGMFYGESMFSITPNASKAAFVTLAQKLPDFGIERIDCQMATPTTRYLGGKFVSRTEFTADLKRQLVKVPTTRGKWSLEGHGTTLP